MSFDNHDYPNRKDHRQPYRRAGACDRSCRPHGGCPYCFGNRMHATRKALLRSTPVACPDCDGTGLVHSHNPRCWSCTGTGRRT